MDQQITSIIDLLDNRDQLGITKLDQLLFQLLPQITNKAPATSLPQFIQLQDSFEYNIALYLIKYYKDVHSDEETLTSNRLLQGLLLIHPKSRAIFHRGANMKLILLLLENTNSLKLEISFISTLIHILLKDLKNFRVFEQQNGCSILIRKFNLNLLEETTKVKTTQNLNYKIIEFLIFYLVDEGDLDGDRKSISDKSGLFKEDFPEIDDLIDNLNELAA